MKTYKIVAALCLFATPVVAQSVAEQARIKANAEAFAELVVEKVERIYDEKEWAAIQLMTEQTARERDQVKARQLARWKADPYIYTSDWLCTSKNKSMAQGMWEGFRGSFRPHASDGNFTCYTQWYRQPVELGEYTSTVPRQAIEGNPPPHPAY